MNAEDRTNFAALLLRVADVHDRLTQIGISARLFLKQYFPGHLQTHPFFLRQRTRRYTTCC